MQADEAWQDFTAAGGTLDSLLADQEGELCGPRPRGFGNESMDYDQATGGEAEQDGEQSGTLAASIQLPDGAGNHELMVLLQSLATRASRDSVVE